MFAAIIPAAFLGFLQDDLSAAFRAFDADLFQIWLCVPTVGKARTSQELAMGPIFYHHIPAADVADHICYLILDFDFFQLFFSL